MYIDTHTHLTEQAFDKDRDEVLQRAAAAGVSKMILPNIDQVTFEPLILFVKQHPSTCFATVGIHPTCVDNTYKEQFTFVENVVKHRRQDIIGIGEIGLDLYWSKTYKLQQQELFIQQLNLAIESNLPVIIHIRNAFDLLFDCLEYVKTDKLHCVFHAFSGSIEIYRRISNLCPHAYFGIGGVVTFSEHLQETVKEMSISHILLETDAPYLTPHPFRKQRNESCYIPYIASCISNIKTITNNDVAQITSSNATSIFKLT